MLIKNYHEPNYLITSPVVVVIRDEASSSESTKLVDSKSELIMEEDSYSWPGRCLIALCPLRGPWTSKQTCFTKIHSTAKQTLLSRKKTRTIKKDTNESHANKNKTHHQNDHICRKLHDAHGQNDAKCDGLCKTRRKNNGRKQNDNTTNWERMN